MASIIAPLESCVSFFERRSRHFKHQIRRFMRLIVYHRTLIPTGNLAIMAIG
jgi:hypothetical protein